MGIEVSKNPDSSSGDWSESSEPALTFGMKTLYSRDTVRFHTGSSYTGQWNELDMCGKGTYAFPNGVVWKGTMRHGVFDGPGTFYYPNKATLSGVWVDGIMTCPRFTFKDGLYFNESGWDYCTSPDRRFYTERLYGLRGRTQWADDHPAREIPKGCYDTVEGFYNPRTKCLSHPLTGEVIRIVTPSEEAWIVKHCRKAWDENVLIRRTKVRYPLKPDKNVWRDYHLAMRTEELMPNYEAARTTRYSRRLSRDSSCDVVKSNEKLEYIGGKLPDIYVRAGDESSERLLPQVVDAQCLRPELDQDERPASEKELDLESKIMECISNTSESDVQAKPKGSRLK